MKTRGGREWRHWPPPGARAHGPYGGRRWERGPWGSGRRRPTAGTAVGIGLVQVIGCTMAARGPIGSAGYALLLAGPVALLFRRRLPVLAYAVAAAATSAYFALGHPGGPAFLAALVALIVAVREGHRWPAAAVTVLAFAGYLAAGRLAPDVAVAPAWSHALVVAAWLAGAHGLAELMKVRAAQYAAVARARAEEERAVAEQERAAAEQQRRQASEERLRIARELHDVLGHHLSLINVQAGVGLHLMDEHPDQARAALVAIKQASAEALREVRAVLGALRPQGEAPPRTPAPSLADVEGLVDAAGLPVTLTIDGEPRPLPPEVDRAAYRIVQEALTNVRRHAGGGATAELTLVYRPGRLDLRVADDGVGPAGDGRAGNGVAGMRERAAALGGTLRAGPRDGGGFEVAAELPLPGNGNGGGGKSDGGPA